jgi:hypothetical protein
MVSHPASDERAKWPHVQAPSTGFIQGVPSDRAANSLAFISLGHLGVKEHDGAIVELIDGDSGQLAVDPRLIAGFHRVVDDYDAHSRPLCQTTIVRPYRPEP